MERWKKITVQQGVSSVCSKPSVGQVHAYSNLSEGFRESNMYMYIAHFSKYDDFSTGVEYLVSFDSSLLFIRVRVRFICAYFFSEQTFNLVALSLLVFVPSL